MAYYLTKLFVTSILTLKIIAGEIDGTRCK